MQSLDGLATRGAVSCSALKMTEHRANTAAEPFHNAHATSGIPKLEITLDWDTVCRRIKIDRHANHRLLEQINTMFNLFFTLDTICILTLGLAACRAVCNALLCFTTKSRLSVVQAIANYGFRAHQCRRVLYERLLRASIRSTIARPCP